MKIRLVDVDSKIPNLALMRISAFHKSKGDDVDWYNPILDLFDTEIVYLSKVFTFTPDYLGALPEGALIKKGGTGYDPASKLENEIDLFPTLDYSLYPDCDYSILFTTRGCIRNCPFCIVRKKEGLIHDVPLTNLNPNGKWIMLLDNNFFSSPNWREHADFLRKIDQPIDFNTGIDLRILNEEQCGCLKRLKIKEIHCAWDNYRDKETVLAKLRLLVGYVKPYKITVYVLVGFENKEIVDSDVERVMVLRSLGVNPFAMGYMDFNNPNFEKSRSVNRFCRWVNRKAIFKKTTWEDYQSSFDGKKDNRQLSLF